jgi:hypothetical protein
MALKKNLITILKNLVNHLEKSEVKGTNNIPDFYNGPDLELLIEKLVKIHEDSPSGTQHDNWPEAFAVLEKQPIKLLLKFSARSNILKNHSLPNFIKMAERIINARDIKSRNTHSTIMLIAPCTIAAVTLFQIFLN